MKTLLKFTCLLTLTTLIASCGSSGSSSGSSPDTGSVPSAPTNVTVTVNATGTWIMWNMMASRTMEQMGSDENMGEDMGMDDGSGITYSVYHSADPNITKDNWNTLAEGVKMFNTASPHRCTQVNKGTTYYAVVTATNEYGESVESERVSFVPEIDS